MGKRKRGSGASIGKGMGQASVSDECPFRVEYLIESETPKAAAAARKKKLKGNPGNQPNYVKLPKEEMDSLETPRGSSSLSYRVLPIAAWSRMGQYRNFIVNGAHHTIGDFVQVRAGSLEQPGKSSFDDGTHWIARVLEIRASDEMHVYLRVIWMYWPRELPWGAQDYHGANELIASNHMEIIGAATVSEGIKVEHLQEFPDGIPIVDRLYWRQKYDYANRNALAELQAFCTCGRYYNPDKLLVHCENPKCRLWLYEDCLIRATLQKISADSPAATEDSEETKVEENQPQKELQETIEGPSRSKASPKKPATPRSKATKAQASVPGSDGLTLDGRLHGKLEREVDAKGEINSTGKVIVETLEGDQSVTKIYPMRCLSCNKEL